MGKHVSEQSRHLKTKDEPQDFPEIDEIDEESRGAKKAKRGFADCGSISFGGIAPVVFAAVLLAALSFLPAEGWMKCVAFLFGSLSSTVLPWLQNTLGKSNGLATLGAFYVAGALVTALARTCFFRRDYEG